jgi:hypothetical protein
MSPTTPRIKAGIITVRPLSIIKVLSSERKSAANVTIEIPRAIATPPKYGIGSVCDLRARLGVSIAPSRIAMERTGQVSKPVNEKAANPKIPYCKPEIDMAISYGPNT